MVKNETVIFDLLTQLLQAIPAAEDVYKRQVYTKRFLADVLGATGASMRSSVQQPLYVPEGMYTQKLLDMFKDTRIKVALVMDEFGGLDVYKRQDFTSGQLTAFTWFGTLGDLDLDLIRVDQIIAGNAKAA